MEKKEDSKIILIGSKRIVDIALKYDVKDNKMYAFNPLLRPENMNYLEVKQINGLNVDEFIAKIKSDDPNNENIIKELTGGIDGKNIMRVIIDGVERDIVLDRKNEDYSLFYRKHDINPFVDIEKENYNEKETKGNPMLEYAKTNIYVLLNKLNIMSKSSKDKVLINDILDQFETDDVYNITNNLDVSFLSTLLLSTIEDKIEYIPDHILRIIEEGNFNYGIRFDKKGDKRLETNGGILTNGEIDYNKVTKIMRNCLAHSQYTVDENGMIHFYRHGKESKRVDFYIHKNSAKYFFSEIYNYNYLEGVFPIALVEKNIKSTNPIPENEFIDYLKSIKMFQIDYFSLKRVDDEQEQEKLDTILSLDLSYFKSSSSNFFSYEEEIISSFNYNIKKHLSDESILSSKKLTEEDIEYINNNINMLGKDHFYQLGSTAQIEIVNQLIKSKYNSQSSLIQNIDSMIEADYLNDDSLTKSSSSYINIMDKEKLLIGTLFNNLFMFCHDHNVQNIDATKVRFPEELYKNYLDYQQKAFYENIESISKDRHDYKALLDSSDTHLLNDEDYKTLDSLIEGYSNEEKRENNRELIYISSKIIEGTATDEEYDIINKQILVRFRNCLAHGRMRIGDININNISDTMISINDTYEDITFFESSFKFGELIESINNKEFLESLLDNNENFKVHSTTKNK